MRQKLSNLASTDTQNRASPKYPLGKRMMMFPPKNAQNLWGNTKNNDFPQIVAHTNGDHHIKVGGPDGESVDLCDWFLRQIIFRQQVSIFWTLRSEDLLYFGEVHVSRIVHGGALWSSSFQLSP